MMISFRKSSFCFAVLVLIAFSISISSGAKAQSGLSEYTLGAGDTISIQVFGNDSLSLESKLSDAGTVSYPFLGELKVQGITVGQLEAIITQGLKGDYLLDPKVTVSIVGYRNFYVEGEVVKPGGYPYQPELTVRKAISLAQGFTELASRRKIYLIAESDPDRASNKVALDDFVNPGDVIIVKESFF